MANAREILNRMRSVQDTQKITNAMYLISSTKLKKSKKMLEETEPYFYTIQNIIRRMLRHMPEMEHPYLDSREEVKDEDRTRGLIVVTGDKGMAGAYNHNIIKEAQKWMEENPNHRLYTVGEVGHHYFVSKGMPVEEQFHYTVQNPTQHRARLISSTLLDEYERRQLDEVWILYTYMINSMSMEVRMERLLPLRKERFSANQLPSDIPMEDFDMLPSPQAVMDMAVPEYITGYIFGALVEAFCCEQNARMMAMQSASDNAAELISQLSGEYNRARQAAITQEITEVIGGAKAQKKKRT